MLQDLTCNGAGVSLRCGCTAFQCKSPPDAAPTVPADTIAARAPSPADPSPADSPVAAGKTPVQLRPLFKSYGKEAQLAPSTVKRWSPVVDRLISHLGHDDAAAISRADIVAWKDEWISVHLIAVDAFHNRWSLPVV